MPNVVTGVTASHPNRVVEKMVKEMDFPNQCRGFVTDGDMAARLKSCFMSRDTGERSVGMPNCVGESN